MVNLGAFDRSALAFAQGGALVYDLSESRDNHDEQTRAARLNRAGRPASVSLLLECLGTVLSAAPRGKVADGCVHRLDG